MHFTIKGIFFRVSVTIYAPYRVLSSMYVSTITDWLLNCDLSMMANSNDFQSIL